MIDVGLDAQLETCENGKFRPLIESRISPFYVIL